MQGIKDIDKMYKKPLWTHFISWMKIMEVIFWITDIYVGKTFGILSLTPLLLRGVRYLARYNTAKMRLDVWYKSIRSNIKHGNWNMVSLKVLFLYIHVVQENRGCFNQKNNQKSIFAIIQDKPSILAHLNVWNQFPLSAHFLNTQFWYNLVEKWS